MIAFDSKKYSILYVDDEAQALKYFPRLYGNTFRCLTAESVAQAREVAAKEGDNLGVVITDQRMPHETGVQLLGWLRTARPQVVRILTTAHSDLDSAIEAVNTGAIYCYVVKPWDERDLRGVLTRAMDLHLLQRERDLLLREKLASLHRVVLMDRVRSFAVLAAGLANRLRNPMLALKTFLDSAPSRPQADLEDGHLQWGDLWRLAQEESQRVLEMVQAVVQRTIDVDYKFTGGLTMASLIEPALARAGARAAKPTIAADTPAIIGDRAMLARMIEILCGHVLTLLPADGRLEIGCAGGQSVWGAPAVRLRIRGIGPEWSAAQLSTLFSALTTLGKGQAEMDLLAAHFAAYHHAGNLVVHAKAPQGPGFEVLLPLDPTAKGELPLERDWVESIFSFPDL